jgi:hypothetical protein
MGGCEDCFRSWGVLNWVVLLDRRFFIFWFLVFGFSFSLYFYLLFLSFFGFLIFYWFFFFLFFGVAGFVTF